MFVCVFIIFFFCHLCFVYFVEDPSFSPFSSIKLLFLKKKKKKTLFFRKITETWIPKQALDILMAHDVAEDSESKLRTWDFLKEIKRLHFYMYNMLACIIFCSR